MNTSIFEHKKWILLIATFACFLWGSAFPSLKIGYEVLDLNTKHYSYKILFAGYRFLIASFMILAFGFKTGLIPKMNRKIWMHLTVLGILQTTLSYVFFYIGLSNTTGVKGSILIGTGTFASIIFAHFYYQNDKLSVNRTLGLIIGFTGVIIVNLTKGQLDFGFKWTGEGFLIFSATVTAAAGIYAKELSKHISPVAVAGFQMLIGALFLISYGGHTIGYSAITFGGYTPLLLIYLAFISATAFTLWFTLIKHHKIGKISIFKFQVPIWGTMLSALILPDESVNLNALIALLFVAGGIILVNLDKPVIQYKTTKSA